MTNGTQNITRYMGKNFYARVFMMSYR